MVVTSSNLNWFLKFFYHWKEKEICNKTYVLFSTTPEVCCHTTREGREERWGNYKSWIILNYLLLSILSDRSYSHISTLAQSEWRIQCQLLSLTFKVVSCSSSSDFMHWLTWLPITFWLHVKHVTCICCWFWTCKSMKLCSDRWCDAVSS